MSKMIPFSEELIPFLLWWTKPVNVASGRPFKDSRPQTTITTDASLLGWGATWNNQVTSGLWTKESRFYTSTFWSQKRSSGQYSTGQRYFRITL